MFSYLMLLGSSSLSESFLARKMDYTGNSISNKISIYLKEFQDCYWEYFEAVFPLWFTAMLRLGRLEDAYTIRGDYLRQKNFRLSNHIKCHVLQEVILISEGKKKPLCSYHRCRGKWHYNFHVKFSMKELPDRTQ